MDMDNNRFSWPGWETVGLIGRGSFGAVYKIQRSIFDDVEEGALKVISIPQNEGDIESMYDNGLDDESITETFHEHLRSIVAEYSLMRKLSDCANIVNCDDIRYVQHDDGIGWDIFIKMELLTPLTKALPASIPEDMVISLAKDMCNALVACKEYDIIHRDIKPQNIFVSKRGDYKLGDFGIAKTVEKTMGGTTIGTYNYMAPEVYNHEPYGSAADIYSLGLVLYWLLNERRLPFLPLPPEKFTSGMDENARKRRFSGEPLPPPAHGSEELKAIVLKACAFDPKDRFASAVELLAALKVMSGEPVVATPPEPKHEPEPDPLPPTEDVDPTVGPRKEVPTPELVPEPDPVPVPEPEPVVAEDNPTADQTVGPDTKTESESKSVPELKSEPKQKQKKTIVTILIASIIIIALAVPLVVWLTSPIKIIRQPQNVTASEGQTVTFEVEASGEGLTYEWYYGNELNGFVKNLVQHGSVYTISAAFNSVSCYCVITDEYGNSVTTDVVEVIVKRDSSDAEKESSDSAAKLRIIQQPQSATVSSGQTVNFKVEASGEALTYEWYYSHSYWSEDYFVMDSFTGNVRPIYATEANDGMSFYCVITDKHGNSVTTNVVTLHVKE